MKYIEVSKKIASGKEISAKKLKEGLIERLEKEIEIESVGDDTGNFKITGTTGSPASITRYAHLDIDIDISLDNKTARIIISGFSKMARSLTILYGILFFLMLVVWFLPNAIETGLEQSDSMDLLISLIFGIYIITDINKKLSEPREFLETALESLNTTFG